ncbi:MAG: hypothetical protein V4722_24855 [Bacteroidota bacterium]
MKKVILCIAIITAGFAANAQSQKFAGAMKKFLTALDSAKTGEDLQNIANDFERVANAEKTQWLPYYYSAYCLVMKSYQEKDKKNIDPLMDKADALLASAEALMPANSEITTMQAMATQCRMMVDWSRGMTLGPKCAQLIGKAQQQMPAENPRAYMFASQTAYNTPEAFGGSKEKGIQLMKKALAAYTTFKPESEMHPNWGKEYVEKTLIEWSK